jgi:hypothetical protein
MNQDLKNLRTEIDEYQNSCRHDTTQIKALMNNDIKVVCLRCDKVVRMPTPNELNDWLKK